MDEPRYDLTFDELCAFYNRFSVFSDKHSVVTLALWTLHTHAMKQFQTTPRLIITSDGPGCGKTQLLDVANCLVHDPWYTGPVTAPTVKARLKRSSPTLLLDETDTIFRNNGTGAEALREVLNMGFKCNAMTSSVSQAEGWSLYIPVALAGISGRMPKTVLDRAVIIKLAKARGNHQPEEFDFGMTEREAEPLKLDLVDMMSWLTVSIDTKRGVPELPTGVIGRPAQVWRPLLAIAEAIGGTVPERARDACLASVDVDDLCVPTSTSHPLLSALREIFDGLDAVFTADILEALDHCKSATWAPGTYTSWRLAADLSDYGVRARNVRIGGQQAKGYAVGGETGLGQAWEEHLS